MYHIQYHITCNMVYGTMAEYTEQSEPGLGWRKRVREESDYLKWLIWIGPKASAILARQCFCDLVQTLPHWKAFHLHDIKIKLNN